MCSFIYTFCASRKLFTELLAYDNGKQQEKRQHSCGYLKHKPALFVFSFHGAYLYSF